MKTTPKDLETKATNLKHNYNKSNRSKTFHNNNRLVLVKDNEHEESLHYP